VGGVDGEPGVAHTVSAPLVVALIATAAIAGDMAGGGGDGGYKETVFREALTPWTRLLAGLWAGLLAEAIDSGGHLIHAGEGAWMGGGGMTRRAARVVRFWVLSRQSRRLGDR